MTIDADLLAGSHDRLDGATSINVPLGDWQPVLNLSYRKYAGYDLDKTTLVEDGPAFQKRHGQFSLTRGFPDQFCIDLEFMLFQESHEVVSSHIFKDKIENNNAAIRLEAQVKRLASRINLKTGMEYSAYNHYFDQVVLSSGYLKKGSATREQLSKADLLYDFELGFLQINGGYGFEFEQLESDRIMGNQRESALHNIFLQGEISALTWLTLLGGIRVDVHSIYGQQRSPKLALMLSPGRQSRLRMSYARGFRAPSFKELYLDFPNSSVGYYVKGNPGLNPENSTSLQTDYELWNDRNYHLRLHFYYNFISNMIDYEYQGVNDGILSYRTANMLKAETWGADWDMEYFPLDWLNLRLGYSYFDSWDGSTRAPLSLKSTHKAQASLQVKPLKRTNFNMRTQYFGRKFYWVEEGEIAQGTNRQWISDYLMLHFNLNFPIRGGFSGAVGGRNMTNYINRTWGPMPGREWYLGISYNYGDHE
jgi:outer membrane receptor for ferrienterochelin and colicins